jgi:hypothetical protein
MEACLIAIIILLLVIFAVNIMGFNAITNMLYSILVELQKKEEHNDKI